MAADDLWREVVTFTADLGQGEELEPARKKAELLGIKEIYIEDLREEFVRDFVFPMFRVNALYEGVYLLGTSIARPLIAKRLVEIAHETGADAIAHGATGKGNDQVRFELSAYALDPDIKVIAPWREWEFKSRTDLIDFAEKHQIRSPRTSAARRRSRSTPTCCTPPRRARCWRTRRSEPPPYVFHAHGLAGGCARQGDRRSRSASEQGDAVSIDGKALSPATLLTRSTSSAAATASAGSIWSRTASSA